MILAGEITGLKKDFIKMGDDFIYRKRVWDYPSNG